MKAGSHSICQNSSAEENDSPVHHLISLESLSTISARMFKSFCAGTWEKKDVHEFLVYPLVNEYDSSL